MTAHRFWVPAALLLAGFTASAQLANGIKAVVHDSVVTFHQVDSLTSQTRAADELRRTYAGDPEGFQKKLNELLADNLETLLERQLIVHEFKTAGYNIPETVIDDAVEERIKSRFGNRRTATKTLQAQGITLEKFREQIRDQFIVEALRSKYVSSEIIISPYKVETYYENNREKFKLEDQVKLLMILIKKTPSLEEDARKKANDLLTKLTAGADFRELAKQFSEGSQRAQGGEWGWVEKSVLREELRTVAFGLKPGEVSPVIDLPDGCYILKVEEARSSHYKPLKDVRVEIEETLRAEERRRIEKAWLNKLRKKTYVRYY